MLVCTLVESDCSLDLSQYLEKQKLRNTRKKKRWWTPCFAILIKNTGQCGDTHSITYVLLVL
jgi:hypothetical protein